MVQTRQLLLAAAGFLATHKPAGFRLRKDAEQMDDVSLFVLVALGLLLYYVQGADTSFTVDVGDVAPQPAPEPQPEPQPQPPTQPAGALGTPTNPIIAMSADPVQIAADVRRTMAFYGRSDDGYWIGLVDHPGGPFSNGLWYQGWNRYWFERANPDNPGSADPNLAGQPAPV